MEHRRTCRAATTTAPTFQGAAATEGAAAVPAIKGGTARCGCLPSSSGSVGWAGTAPSKEGALWLHVALYPMAPCGPDA